MKHFFTIFLLFYIFLPIYTNICNFLLILAIFSPIFTHFTHFYTFLHIFTHFYTFLHIFTHFNHFYLFWSIFTIFYLLLPNFSQCLPIITYFYHNALKYIPFLLTCGKFTVGNKLLCLSLASLSSQV